MPTKPRTIDIGAHYEKRACQFLQQQGYQLIEKNYRTKMGEIDLIMRDRKTLVFVEVRYRKQQSHGSGAETVTHTKQQRLRKAAEHYLQRQFGNQPPDCRFDVVSVSGEDWQMEWIQNAF